MIAFIEGTIDAYGSDWIIVDNHGIGWQIAYPHTDEVHLQDEVKIYTYMHVTDQGVSLFGFSSREEKDLFLKLISVKGIGPKTVMNMLAKNGYNAIVKSIADGDVTALKKMPGIGAKSASQIVLDLKGKLVAADEPQSSKKAEVEQLPQAIADALDGLRGLGYKNSELNGVTKAMLAQPGLSTKQYLSMGLRYMARNGG